MEEDQVQDRRTQGLYAPLRRAVVWTRNYAARRTQVFGAPKRARAGDGDAPTLMETDLNWWRQDRPWRRNGPVPLPRLAAMVRRASCAGRAGVSPCEA